MAIRRVLVLIQVGGRAGEGGCAALVTLGASRLGRRNKHTPPQSKQSVNGKQGAGGQGAPLTRLRCPVVPAARKLVFMPLLLLLVRFRHFGDGLFAYLPHILAVYPAAEVIVKDELLLFLAHRTGDVLIHDIRNKELRKAAGVDNLLS